MRKDTTPGKRKPPFMERPRSLFPLLERAFVEVFCAWTRRMRLGLGRTRVPKSVREAAERLLNEIRDSATDYDGKEKGYDESKKLYVRRETAGRWNDSWARAVGSRFRRVAQEVLDSETNVREYTPAGHVVILGAGASLHARLPKTEEIPGLVRSDLNRRRKLWIRDKVDAIMNQLPTEDFEEILGVLQTKAWSKRAYRQEVADEDDCVRQLLISYKNVILERQFSRWRWRDTQRFLKKLDEESDGTWAIVSFNQDTVIPYELEQMPSMDWSRETGFGIPVGKDPNAPPPDRRVYIPHGNVAFHRPHGWPLRGLQADDRAFKRRNATNGEPRRARRNYAPLILVPSFLKVYVDDVLTKMMARVIFELLHAQHILVVGFRLRPDDLIVSNVIRYALRANNQLRSDSDPRTFTLVGPDARDFATERSLGSAWAPIIADLASNGWRITTAATTFVEFGKRSAPLF